MKQRKITSRTVRGGEPDSKFDREFWSSLTAGERFLQAWNLSKMLWELSKKGKYEPGLPRSVARVIRGQR